MPGLRVTTPFDLRTLRELSPAMELPEKLRRAASGAERSCEDAWYRPGETPISWGYAETITACTLAVQQARSHADGPDHPGRGTFSHHRAVFAGQKDAGRPFRCGIWRRSAAFRPVRLVPVGRGRAGIWIRLLDFCRMHWLSQGSDSTRLCQQRRWLSTSSSGGY